MSTFNLTQQIRQYLNIHPWATVAELSAQFALDVNILKIIMHKLISKRLINPPPPLLACGKRGMCECSEGCKG